MRFINIELVNKPTNSIFAPQFYLTEKLFSMQNKSAIWTFTILLTLACLFQISYSWVTNSVEKEAEQIAQDQLDSILATKQSSITYGADVFNLTKGIDQENLRNRLMEDQLRKVAHEPAYPILGESYQECKKRELSLGLDLKGGMAVTLEVSIPDLIDNLAGKSKNPTFRTAYNGAYEKWSKNPSEDFIDVFVAEYKANNPEAKLITPFSAANKDKFPSKMTDEEVIAKLREEKESAMSNIEEIMNNRINKFGVSNATLQRLGGSGRIQIELPGVKDKIRVRNLIQATANLEFWETYNNFEISDALEKANEVLSKTLYPEIHDGTAETNTNGNDSSDLALNATAAAESNATTSDSLNNKDSLNPLTAVTPGDTSKKSGADTTLSDIERRKRFPIYAYLNLAVNQTEQGGYTWEQGSRIGTCSLADTARLNALIHHPALNSVWPKELRLLWGAKPERYNGVESNQLSLYCINAGRKGVAPLDGSAVTEARYDFSQMTNQVEVVMQMNAQGAEKWANLTEKNANKAAIAIVMDGYVYSAPWVNGKITGGRSSISGSFTPDEAGDLANVLKSGTLPAKAQIVDSVEVGPSLGESNINSGINSFVIALFVVLLYMYVYYKKAGLIANVALIANLFFLIGALASIQASLTLPGIAGIVLTIGMAVDANVLIYERIREELRQGKSLKTAVNEGFSRALSSIIDGNLTTLLTAIVLAFFGSGPILGFATTLIIGIFTSLFSAIFISRVIIHELLDRKKDISFSTKFTEKVLVGTVIPFMKKRKLYYAISAVLLVASIGSLATRGLDMGVEFTGGYTYEIRFEEEANYDKIRNNLSAVFVENGQNLTPEVKKIENKYKAKITTKYMINDQSSEAEGKVEDKLKEGLKEWEGKYTIEGSRKVGAVISDELIESSISSIIFSLLIIFTYILIRFRRWQFGLAAVLALFHDAVIVMGVFSMLYGVLPFSLEVDQAFIAAILTVVGYSINDTVIVFDRIREYLGENRKMDSEKMVDAALNSTLSRTVNTSLTTIIVLLTIFIFGGDAIKGFTFALLVGVLVGTYSSLFVASPMVYDMAGKSLSESAPVKRAEA